MLRRDLLQIEASSAGLEQDPHYRTHVEVHLAHHLRIDLGRQHPVVAADDRRIAKSVMVTVKQTKPAERMPKRSPGR